MFQWIFSLSVFLTCCCSQDVIFSDVWVCVLSFDGRLLSWHLWAQFETPLRTFLRRVRSLRMSAGEWSQAFSLVSRHLVVSEKVLIWHGLLSVLSVCMYWGFYDEALFRLSLCPVGCLVLSVLIVQSMAAVSLVLMKVESRSSWTRNNA